VIDFTPELRKEALRRFLSRQSQRRPLVMPVILEL
jgi:hypothetical protein